jgi:DNA-directed RNA polymerase beta subunit
LNKWYTVSEEATKDLDENGMIRIGAEVKPGDILMEKLLKRNQILLQKEACNLRG